MKVILEIEKLKYKDLIDEITISFEENKSYLFLCSDFNTRTSLIDCLRGKQNYSGNITLFNNNIKNLKTGCTFTDIGFFLDEEFLWEETILEELTAILISKGFSEEKAKKQIFSLTKKFNIEHILLKKQNSLLEHEKKLLMFILSILHDPKIIIIGSSFECFDNKTKQNMLDYIKSQTKKTIIFITDNSEYYNITDNYLLLKNKKLIKYDSKEELFMDEKTLLKQGIKIPFCAELSTKLMTYNLLTRPVFSIQEMVDEIWN